MCVGVGVGVGADSDDVSDDVSDAGAIDNCAAISVDIISIIQRFSREVKLYVPIAKYCRTTLVIRKKTAAAAAAAVVGLFCAEECDICMQTRHFYR